MMILRLAGHLLVLFGITAGVLLFLPAFGRGLETSPPGLWFLFVACILGGLLLAGIAASSVPRTLLRVSGGALVLFTLASVVVLLLAAVGWVRPIDTSNLWILFLFSLPFGLVLILIGEKAGKSRSGGGGA